jgi:hypothetical protein
MPIGSWLRRRLTGWQPDGVLSVSEVLGGQRRFRAVSGVYQNSRQEDLLWFAFRQPQEWVHLDVPDRLNGTMHVQVGGVRRAVLVVDGAVAVKSSQAHPGYRRLHAMVEHGMDWPGPPDSTEDVLWEGRQAVRCRWPAEVEGQATFDLDTGLVVQTEWPGEIVELTGIRFDDEVDPGIFVPPDRTLSDWRGGTASIVRDPTTGQCSASWTAMAGPGHLHIAGPRAVTLDEARAWATAQTDDVQIRDDDHT